MPTDSICPSCGGAWDAASGCCSGCGLAADDLVASWVSGRGEPVTVGEDRSCPGCGYAGEPGTQGDLTICPACLLALPGAGDPTTRPLRRVVHCPGCDLAIGITDADRDRTVVCARCRYFLGCVLKGGRRRA